MPTLANTLSTLYEEGGDLKKKREKLGLGEAGEFWVHPPTKLRSYFDSSFRNHTAHAQSNARSRQLDILTPGQSQQVVVVTAARASTVRSCDGNP